MKRKRTAKRRETLQVVCDFCGAVATVDITDCNEVHAINAAIDKGLSDQGWKVGKRSYRCPDCQPKPRKKARKETAAEAYASLRGDNGALLDLIGQELGTHEERAAADPKNWGRAGDLSYVREKLTQVLAFLMNADDEAEAEARIEEHLAEMRG